MHSRNSTLLSRTIAGLLLLASATAQAALIVQAPWVRPTPERAATAAYMSLTSSEGAVLKEVRSTIATSVVIRATASGARTLPQLALPAGIPVVLSPDSVHLVLRGLAHPLAAGERIPLVLTIETANGARQEVSVTAEVRSRSPADDARRGQQPGR